MYITQLLPGQTLCSLLCSLPKITIIMPGALIVNLRSVSRLSNNFSLSVNARVNHTL